MIFKKVLDKKIWKIILPILGGVIVVVLLSVGLMKYYHHSQNNNQNLETIQVDLTPQQRTDLQNKISSYLDLLKAYPNSFQTRLDLGMAQAGLGNIGLAKQYLQESLKYISNNPTDYLNLADDFRQLKDYDQAYNIFWQAQKADPKYELTYQQIVDFYTWYYPQKQSDIESVYLLGIKELGNNQQGLKKSLAAYYIDHGRYKESIPLLEDTLKLYPNDLWCLQQLRIAKEKTGTK